MNGVPIEVTMQGIDKVLAQFETLNRRMQQSIVGKAARSALDVVIPLARQNIAALPFRSGGKGVRVTLGASLRKKTSNKPSATVVSALLDYKKGGHVRLSHLFEFGFNHPSGKRMPAYHMMSQAWETQTDEVQRIMAERMGKLIKEAMP